MPYNFATLSPSPYTVTAVPTIISPWTALKTWVTNTGNVAVTLGGHDVVPGQGLTVQPGATVEFDSMATSRDLSAYAVAAGTSTVLVRRLSDHGSARNFYRQQVSADTGVPEDVIAGVSEAEMRASAARLNAWKTAP